MDLTVRVHVSVRPARCRIIIPTTTEYIVSRVLFLSSFSSELHSQFIAV